MRRRPVRPAWAGGARAGLALLVVIGVLGVLAVLASAFTTLTQLERKASRQKLYSTKAFLLARSGIEDAQARLSGGQDTESSSVRYGGEDRDLSGGALDATERAGEVFRIGTANVLDCPVRFAMRPSFPVLSGAEPRSVRVEGRQRGYSGRLGSERAVWALKVEDESGKINVNGGFLDTSDRDDQNQDGIGEGDGVLDFRDTRVRGPRPPAPVPVAAVQDRGWNSQLVRILGLLGAQAEIGIPTLGTDVVARRPAGGYASIAQLQTRIGTTRDLSPYLTVSSWVDRKVVHPNGYATQAKPLMACYTTTPSEIKKTRMPLALEEGGRPPVNLNAAPRPVLVALLDGLSGMNWHNPQVPFPSLFVISSPMAQGIADALVARRGTGRPPGTWSEFGAFCDGLVDGGILSGMPASPAKGGGNLCAADLLKANFDPNTDLNKQHPDQLLYRWIDKSDLLVWSTEGSLGPTGIFTVSAVGRCLGNDGRLLAERVLAARVEVFSQLRQTTQKDFVGSRGALQDYLSLADPSPPAPIPPQRTTGASAAWNTWGAGQGLAVVTYPAAPTALPGRASVLDGCVGLATTELEPTDFAPGMPLMFLHHFDDGWDADRGNPAARLPGAYDARLQADVSGDLWPPAPAEPSTLYPDGAHAQLDRSPGFKASGNLPAFSGNPPGNRGVISYWVKGPAVWDTTTITLPRIHVNCWRAFDDVQVSTQTLRIGSSSDFWGIVTENRMDGNDMARERQFHVHHYRRDKMLLPGMRWNLVTAMFDTNETVLGQDNHLWVRGVRGTGDGSNDDNATYWGGVMGVPFDPSINEDLITRVDGVDVPLILGSPYLDVSVITYPQMADQVVDEFAVYDFGDDALDALDAAERLQLLRYTWDGRYYKADDGRFLSSVIEPAAGRSARLLNARWTAYLPSETRQEINGGVTPMFLPATGNPRKVDEALKNARVELDLLGEAGTLAGPALRSLRKGGRIDVVLARFRYRLRFVNALDDPLDHGVVETPLFDDITVAWQAAEGPRILSWEGA